MAALTPWPPRSQRKAAIRAAREEKERSQRAAGHAAAVCAELGELAARNHFAASITRQIIARHKREGGAE